MPENSNPGEVVVAGVERILALARTWLVWDGRPRLAEDGARLYTPHKAIRRHTHHLVDHLAEIEALLDDRPSRPDEWRGSFVTLAGDWAPFTEPDLNEAEQCLRRLADVYVHRLAAAGPDEWDKHRDPHWTLRFICEHVGEPWYAEQVGDLGC
ncbi:hypothetical protein [Amycolatopsis nigrescens]|uniref:hypothetical protein n=1 Tax=Amycolatopsis nigrescens TaxID=381445 RepID=UPI0004771E09|nr:hypothetical protein [Amycolatopsis nigrescens]